MTPEDLRNLLEQGQAYDQEQLHSEGVLTRGDGEEIPYMITVGWNVYAAFEIDQKWKKHNLELMAQVDAMKISQEEKVELLSKVQLEDYHWVWLAKAAEYSSDEYVWIFIFAEDIVQGACLIYYPKESLTQDGNIFYVEYVAAAPWNRTNPLHESSIKGIGSTLIRTALKYAVEELGLKPGFSLHSLPQATGYYEHIGMINVPEEDKPKLKYYEMPLDESNKMLEAS